VVEAIGYTSWWMTAIMKGETVTASTGRLVKVVYEVGHRVRAVVVGWGSSRAI
jgi:hypothetical protein